MKYLSPKFILIGLGIFALLASGCAKKPVRPDPSATMVGSGQGGLPGSGDLGGSLQGGNFSSDLDATGLDERNAAAAAGEEKKGLFEDVYFDFDQSAIKAGERAKLQAAKDYLTKNPAARVRLEGYCDWRGTAEYNLALGDRRANSAKRYLTGLGIAADRVDTVSQGSLKAIEKGTAAEMAKDRRVEIVVIGQ